MKYKFMAELNNLLIKHFQLISENKLDEQLRQRINGFIMAGEVIDLIARDEAFAQIEKLHFEVLGETVSQRAAKKEQKIASRQAYINDDDNFFDKPAYERLKETTR